MAMIEEIGSDQDALVLYDELIEAVTKYVAVRAEWIRMTREEKMRELICCIMEQRWKEKWTWVRRRSS